ncbi:MAG: SRPBCC family protein [Pirellulales bacterium]|nr:SRPBCC family protein [Pirellulales bacterium]
MARAYRLQRAQLIRRPRPEVFEFFSAAENLEAITPPALSFQILTPLPIELRSGTLIDYRLKLMGIPFNWQTRIDLFEPPLRFRDSQLQGPYRRWEHLHEFFETAEGTLMIDTIDYEIPLGPLGALARMVFVSRQLDAIFDYRRERVFELLSHGPGNLPATGSRGPIEISSAGPLATPVNS